MAPSVHSVKDNVDLTPKEKQIFECLIDVVRHFNLQTQLRVAGGWVRDKLLGKECHDIDIALDNICGIRFCEKVNQFLSDAGEVTTNIGVIKSNPKLSKHLETGTMSLFGVSVDFVNLRSEDYHESSRIPNMRFGTPEEDAFRRDLTINSLFYNIEANCVEDLTGRGMKDLRYGRIVTPLPPKQTFMDDPLRVLRAIRFCARFSFELDEEMKTAACDKEVVAAVVDKISRERIGHEIDVMLSGNQPVMAMRYVYELQLFGAVFRQPNSVSDGYDERLCVDLMDSASKLLKSTGSSSFTVDQKRLCLYGALFLPLRGIIYKAEKDGEAFPVVNYLFHNSLKLKKSDAETVMSLHTAAERFLCLIHYMTSNHDASKLRVLVGLLLGDIRGFWRCALVLCLVLNNSDQFELNEQKKKKKKKKMYRMVEDWIIGQGLDRIWEVAPLLNGRQIMACLGLRKGGPVVGEWQRKVREWQLAHSSGTEEECIEWITNYDMQQTKRAKLE